VRKPYGVLIDRRLTECCVSTGTKWSISTDEWKMFHDLRLSYGVLMDRNTLNVAEVLDGVLMDRKTLNVLTVVMAYGWIENC
jgi:hypothetical protein